MGFLSADQLRASGAFPDLDRDIAQYRLECQREREEYLRAQTEDKFLCAICQRVSILHTPEDEIAERKRYRTRRDRVGWSKVNMPPICVWCRRGYGFSEDNQYRGATIADRYNLSILKAVTTALSLLCE